MRCFDETMGTFERLRQLPLYRETPLDGIQIAPVALQGSRRNTFGFGLRQEAVLRTLTADVLKSSEIEGERLEVDQVRSSIARRTCSRRRSSSGG